MVWLLLSALALGAGGCRRDQDTVLVASSAPDESTPPVMDGVILELEVEPRVDVGDDLALRLSVRNDSNAPITLVRPVYGSWELARHPRYELRWTDEAGEEIPDPLGFAPGLSCGTLDPITRADLVSVAPGETAALPNAPAARTSHEVLPTARPGRYQLRVGYIAQGIEGATELSSWSTPRPVEILGGDAARWSARRDQLEAERNHEWIAASPTGLVEAPGGETWVIVRDYRHRVEDGQKRPAGDLWMQRVDADLQPVGAPVHVREGDDELGWVGVGQLGDVVLLVETPGPVGGRSIETQRVALGGAPVVGAPTLLQPGPGNPYVTRVEAVGDHFAILHDGADADDGALTLTLVSSAGERIASRRVAGEVIDFELLVDRGELLVISTERGRHEGGVIRRVDGSSGERVGDPVSFDFDPSHSLAGARLGAGVIELGWADSGTRGDDPKDLMGLHVGGFSLVDGRAQGRRPLSPESRTQAHFGQLAWHGNQVLAADLAGPSLHTRARAELGVELSASASGTVVLSATTDGFFVALWSDHRDDDSRACRELEQCVSEVWGARLTLDSAVRMGPRRLTTLARSKPFVPSSFEWQEYEH